MKNPRTHRQRKQRRLRRLEELIKAGVIHGKRFGNRWRINDIVDYWPNSGRVVDRRNPESWISGKVSGPDQLAGFIQGSEELRNVRVTSRATSWRATWEGKAASWEQRPAEAALTCQKRLDGFR